MDVTQCVLAQHVVLQCQFSKPGRHRSEPQKGLKEANLSLGDPAHAIYWPQNRCWQK